LFPIGGCKVLRQSAHDVATVVGAGVTVFEALKAYDELMKAGVAIRVIDLYSIQPIDEAALRTAAAETGGRVVTVEDHYAGGGIGDAVSAERLVEAAAEWEGPAYIRTSRPKTPVIYGPGERFPVGGCKVLRQSAADVATVVGAGVTVFEALEAYGELMKAGVAILVIDLYSIQPIDDATLRAAAIETGGRVVTVEDHYAGGGIGDAVAAATTGVATVRILAVRDIPRSGTPDELLDRFGLSARHIVETVRQSL
jgi:transketolase C-terminal domain/subunit